MKWTVPVGLITVIVIGVIVALSVSNNNTAPSPTTMPSTDTNLEPANGTSETTSLRNYVVYSPEVLTETADMRRVLFFYANWCPTCRPVDEELNTRTSEIPEDVSVIRVNYNDSDTDADEEALAEKYGITYQHTFVEIDAEGNEVQKWNGGDLSNLLDKLDM